MATNLAQAYVQIIPSADGIKQQLSNLLGKDLSDAGDEGGKTFGQKMVSGIKAVVAAAGLGKAIGQALTEGADLQQSLGGVETLFKKSADVVVANAKNAYKTAGMSANDYMETVTSFSASLLQGLSGDTSKAAEVADMAIRDMSDNANKMGTDMASIQNAYQGFAKQNYTMLDNLKLGYGGTKTEMERLLADAEKLTGVKYDISNLSDVYEAINVIQNEMGITGTTAEEASETFSGSLASMKAAAQNLLGNLALGEDISESLFALKDTIRTFVFDNLLPMVGNIASQIPNIVEGALYFIPNILGYLRENMGSIIQGGIDIVGGLATGIAEALPNIGEAAFHMVSELINVLASTDWGAVASDLITNLRGRLDLGAIEILGTDGDIVGSLMSAITNGLPDILNMGIEMMTNLVTGILESIPEIVSSAGEMISQFIGFIMENLPTIIDAGIKLISNLASGIIDNLPAIVSSIVQVITKILSTITSNLPQILQKGIELLGKLAAGIIKAVPDLLAKIPGIISDIKAQFTSIDWAQVGKDILNGIAKGLKNGVSAVTKAAKEAASSALNAAKEKLGIHSPSKIFENEVGKMIDEGLAEGIKKNVGTVSDSMKELSNATVGMIDTDVLKTNISEKNAALPSQDVTDQLVVVVDNTVLLDGTPLKDIVANYTIKKINSNQKNTLKAKGVYA